MLTHTQLVLLLIPLPSATKPYAKPSGKVAA